MTQLTSSAESDFEFGFEFDFQFEFEFAFADAFRCVFFCNLIGLKKKLLAILGFVFHFDDSEPRVKCAEFPPKACVICKYPRNQVYQLERKVQRKAIDDKSMCI